MRSSAYMNLEDKLINHIPVNQAAHTPNVYGIEVELEGRNVMQAPAEVMAYWKHHADNSLRQLEPGSEAIEYVSIHPYNAKTTEKAVQLLFEFLNSPKVHVFESYRTSIHVHVNFAMESFRTIYNFMTLSLILDELLVSQNGDHRIGNNFCLRAKDALGQVVSLSESIQKGNHFFGINNHDRYSSINFASLLKFGSIEFRSLECTTHEGRLMHWLGTLAQIKEKAMTYKNPIEVIQQFSLLQPREFLTSVLGPFAHKYAGVSGMESMLHTGMRIAQDLAFCSEWLERPPGEPEDTKPARKHSL